MNFLGKLIFNIAVSAFSAYAVYDYIPLSFFESWGEPNLGVSITTINGTDTISSSRSTINTNFSNLNNGKVENSTTSMPYLSNLAGLVQVGTLTSGTWNASTIGIAYGGTGTTTGKQTYGVLLGDGAYGITVASTTGTSGQFLTSNGAGAYPTWQTSAISQSADYNFTGTYFGVKNLYASSTSANPIILNTVSYNTPSTQGSASSTLINDGSGNLSWRKYNKTLALPEATGLKTSSSTIVNYLFAANTLSVGDAIKLTFSATTTSPLSQAIYNVGLSLGGQATSTCGFESASGNKTATSTYNYMFRVVSSTKASYSCVGIHTFDVTANPSAGTGIGEYNVPGTQTTEDGRNWSEGNAVIDITTAQRVLIEGIANNNSQSSVFNITAEWLPL